MIDSTVDRFGSVCVELGEAAVSAEIFQAQLHDCLPEWQAAGHLRVWLSIAQAQSSLVPVAIDQGFAFHRVQEQRLLLLKQLDPSAVLPPHAATHHIGAGAVVFNDDGELLVISERTGPVAGGFKVPGGYIEPGEHIASGIVREVREETGIETAFESLVLFRHMHQSLYTKSNIYFVCRLRAISAEITIDPVEIAECQWMQVADFMAHERTQAFHRGLVNAALAGPSMQPGYLPNHYYPPERAEFFFANNYTP